MSTISPKVALVTGAGTGLGSDLAERLAGEGYAVAIHYRRSQEGAQVVKEKILGKGGQAELFAADLSDDRQCLSLIGKITEVFAGRLDLLINGAGVYQPVVLEEMSAENWFTGLHSTATAAFLATKASLPLLRQSGAGRIINIGDSSADRPTAREMALGYHIGKTGVLMLTRSFARSEAPYGITVNMVSPGYLENSLPGVEPESIPAGRFGSFTDIWSVIQFLIQPHSSYLTGSNLVVSGGWNLR